MADFLKTNYVDDVLDTSKNTRRKYNMITNPDGTVSFEDVTAYKQVGDSYGSAILNAQNTDLANIKEDISELNSKKAISESAVYNFIKNDGSIANIQNNIEFFDRYYEGIINRIGGGVFGNFITGYGCYAFIPLDRADLRTITLNSVVVSGDSTEYLSRCRVTTGFSQGFVIESKVDLAGKLCTVSFNASQLS